MFFALRKCFSILKIENSIGRPFDENCSFGTRGVDFCDRVKIELPFLRGVCQFHGILAVTPSTTDFVEFPHGLDSCNNGIDDFLRCIEAPSAIGFIAFQPRSFVIKQLLERTVPREKTDVILFQRNLFIAEQNERFTRFRVKTSSDRVRIRTHEGGEIIGEDAEKGI